MSKLTVILPCAGEGSRLSLPYSKEIYSIEKNKCLIDYSFELFKNYGRKDVEFVVTINEKKLDLIKYLSKYRDRFNISFTFFNPNETEYTGSIKSAKHLFGEKNLVLLPDTFLKMKSHEDVVDLICASLFETGFTFFYKKESDQNMLKTKGSLLISDDGFVLDYNDKPETNFENYNAFWTAFAFRKRVFETCIEFMEKSTLRHKVLIDEIQKTPIYRSKAIEVNKYVDLGTWQEIYNFIDENNN
jgi:NDP-sugar pyrophosphorylase family protein